MGIFHFLGALHVEFWEGAVHAVCASVLDFAHVGISIGVFFRQFVYAAECQEGFES